MGRIEPIPPDSLDDDQRAYWESVVSGPRGPSLGPSPRSLGALFDTWIRAPKAGQPAAQLGEQLRFFGTLDDLLREMVTLTVAAHWGAEFEFWAHAKAAKSAGLSDEIIEALRKGTTPPLSDRDLLVYSVVGDLLQAKGMSDSVYDELHSLLGESALVELVMVVGYYSMVCISMRAFAIGLPDDVEPFWPPR
ncbi:MAG TPA: carboxymuconolactone decarboxylase family protein [Acidimicrobiales bacterium]|nr:carboxymuconolactone decarboxylase family protein [Acidimicrobiales bacterium]